MRIVEREAAPFVALGADQDGNAIRGAVPDRFEGQFGDHRAVDARLERHPAAGQPETRSGRNQRFRFQGDELVDIVGGRQAEFVQQAIRGLHGPGQRIRGTGRTADEDPAMEESLCRRARQQCADAHGARRLAEDGHVSGIAAERRNVVANPAKGFHLIEQTFVARRGNSAAGQLVEVEPAERADPVVDGHDHDIAPPGEVRSVIYRRATRPALEAATVDPHEHRAPGIVVARREHVQLQAVLVAIGGVADVEDERQHPRVLHRLLPGLLAPIGRRADAAPGHRGFRGVPALLTHGGCGERDAPEGVDAVVAGPLHLAVVRLDDGHDFSR